MTAKSIIVFALLTCAVPIFAAVTGTVMTPDGQAITGARVSVFALETPEARRARLLSANPEAVPLSSTQTDSKGRFTLDSPKDAIADLRVVMRGYEPWQRRIERDEDAGAIALSKADMKSGSVKANGKPVANAVVVLSYGAGTEYIARTDAEGRYEVPDPKRARAISILHPDFAIVDENSQSFTGGITTLNRTLTASTPVAGRVVSADGKTPVAKATIFVDGWPLGASGDDGTFTITRVPVKWATAMAQTSSLVGTRSQTSERPLTIRVAKAATIAGRVLDSKSKLPVAGAFVRVSSRIQGMPRQNDFAWGTTTDAKGNYSLNVAPGSYAVSASHPAYDSRNNVDANLSSGQSAVKEIVITPFARVSGVVLDEERKPVAAAAITTQEAREGGMEFMMRMGQQQTSMSGPDGRFSMRIRTDSELKLRATKKAFPSVLSDSIKLAPAERRANIVLTIPTGVAVTGKVTDRSGTGLSGVAVSAQPVQGGGRGGMQRILMGFGMNSDDDPVRTGSDGTFTIRVTEGTYDFAFRREGFSTKNVRGKSVSVAGPNVVEAALDPSVEIEGRVVRGGQGVGGVTIFSFGDGDATDTTTGPDGSFMLKGLSRGNTRLMLRQEEEFVNEQKMVTAPGRDVVIELPAGVRVSGRVTEKSTHKPVTSFQVGVSISRSAGGMMIMAPPLMRSVTSDDGTFTLDNVPTGAVNFVASAPGYSTSRLNLNVEEGKPVTNLEVELDTGVRLVGKITGPDGAAVSDAQVRLAMMAGPGMNIARATDKRTTTNSDGEYELEALEPGEETIEIMHSKYLTERKTVQLKGRETRLDVQLSAGDRVSGVVVTESGAAVPEAEVMAMASGGMPRTGKTDAAGRFEFDSLSPARYRFTASKTGYADGSVADVDVASGVPVRIVMKSGGTIYGFVRGLPEDELSSTLVEARGGDGYASSAVDSSGAYKIEGVPSGTVSVRATMTGRGFSSRKTSPSQTVEMTAGTSRQLDVEFRNDTVIKGRIRRNGQSVPGAAVSFRPKSGGIQTTATVTSDDAGNYTVSGLDDGEYTVSVTDMQRFTSFTTTYEVRGSGTFDIDHTANAVRGRVVDSSSGDPIADARVELRNTSSSSGMPFAERMAATDVNGVFNLDLVSPGNYTMTATKEGYANDTKNLIVSDRATDDVELRLVRGEGINLKVVDARDGRLLSAGVVVFDMQGRVVLDRRGFFPGEGSTGGPMTLSVAAGSYQVTIAAMGYGTRSVTLRSPATETVSLSPAARLVIRSSHSARQAYRLVDAGGTQYPRYSEQPQPNYLNPSPGTTIVDNIAGGTYTLQILGDNNTVIGSKQIVIGNGQTLDVEI